MVHTIRMIDYVYGRTQQRSFFISELLYDDTLCYTNSRIWIVVVSPKIANKTKEKNSDEKLYSQKWIKNHIVLRK